MRRANIVKTHRLQAYQKKNRKLYEKENKLLLLLLNVSKIPIHSLTEFNMLTQ